jgi:hypothetical protein
LAEPVNDVEDVADPVDGDGNRGPGQKEIKSLFTIGNVSPVLTIQKWFAIRE